MKWPAKGNLRLGSNVVELLLPQRRPFLMVDFIHAFEADPVPSLEAGRHITANEPIFAGHFPGLHVWPGSFTIEGLGQTGILLIVLVHLRRAAEAQGLDPETVLDELRNLELGFRFQPGHRPEAVESLMRRLEELRSSLAVGTSVEMKFPRPVFAGERLDYRVKMTGEHPGGVRFQVEATVEGAVVATGVMMGALMSRPMLDDRKS